MSPRKNPWSKPDITSPSGAFEADSTMPLDAEVPTGTHEIHLDVLQPKRRHALELIRGPGSPRTFTLSTEEVIIGRAVECTVRIESNDVSRRHLRLTSKEDEYACEDLGSRNGVYLNGVKIHSAVLRNEDQLQLGDAVFIYREGS
jgi:pSer/pThr/pTyr-binding forkhead associated (FHA) protein